MAKTESRIYNGVEVEFVGIDGITDAEPQYYVDLVRARTTEPLKKIKVVGCADGSVDLHYELQGPKFERIRRITGYLSGTLDTWNDAKRAEERDRVKHDLGEPDDDRERAYWRQFIYPD